jgi:hypothetical protein
LLSSGRRSECLLPHLIWEPVHLPANCKKNSEKALFSVQDLPLDLVASKRINKLPVLLSSTQILVHCSKRPGIRAICALKQPENGHKPPISVLFSPLEVPRIACESGLDGSRLKLSRGSSGTPPTIAFSQAVEYDFVYI